MFRRETSSYPAKDGRALFLVAAAIRLAFAALLAGTLTLAAIDCAAAAIGNGPTFGKRQQTAEDGQAEDWLTAARLAAVAACTVSAIEHATTAVVDCAAFHLGCFTGARCTPTDVRVITPAATQAVRAGPALEGASTAIRDTAAVLAKRGTTEWSTTTRTGCAAAAASFRSSAHPTIQRVSATIGGRATFNAQRFARTRHTRQGPAAAGASATANFARGAVTLSTVNHTPAAIGQ